MVFYFSYLLLALGIDSLEVIHTVCEGVDAKAVYGMGRLQTQIRHVTLMWP